MHYISSLCGNNGRQSLFCAQHISVPYFPPDTTRLFRCILLCCVGNLVIENHLFATLRDGG